MIVGSPRIGRYDIERHLASGGMAEVYQARDSLTGILVALKIPHDGEEIWEAERTGAMLQIELSKRDERVPRVFEIGCGEERFVAMEYVEGEDLSRRLLSGPLEWCEATLVAIELCGVLGTARSCCADNGEPGGIVHGDIKPRNIRLQGRGHIKVLDFGIAKALRQTRSETRNLYGSVPYSSPERLDRGHVDYHSDLWSVAVVLYEMLEGRRPFRAADDVDLERAIRSGARPAPLERPLPAAFGALLDRAFAPGLAERYASAEEMERDLRAVLLDGEEATRRTGAAAAEVTRRTLDPALEPETRRTLPAVNGAAQAEITRRTTAAAAQPVAPAAGPAPTAASPAPVRKRRLPWKAIGFLILLFFAVREISALGAARNLRAGLPSRPRGDAGPVWTEYERVIRGHSLVHLSGVDGAVRDWMVSHADDLLSRYRSDTPTIYENGWRSAEALLQHAITIDPGNRHIQARLEFCRAHLLRIAARDSKQPDQSNSSYDEAVSRFERAAYLWPGWGDPQIGLAQIYAYGKRDPERTSEALGRARQDGYPFGERETALLGDAYRMRAERRWAGSTDAFDPDQLYRHLERIREDCVHAMEQYELVPAYAGVSKNLRAARELLAKVDARLRALSDEPEPLPLHLGVGGST